MKKIKRILLTIIIAFFGLIPARSQSTDLLISHISLESGLSQVTINCIYQDKEGFMWFGTEDGLNKYDGYSFIIYRNDILNANSLSHNSVTTISEDLNGNLWIGTRGGGVSVFNKRIEAFYNFVNDENDSTSISSNHIASFFEFEDKFYIGSKNAGANLFNYKTRTFNNIYNPVAENIDLYNAQISKLYTDKNDNTWIVTNIGWLFQYDKATKKVIMPAQKASAQFQQIQYDNIMAFCEDSAGGLWMASQWNGLYYINESKGIYTQYLNDPADPNSISGNDIRALACDHDGNVWIGAYNGLNKFNKKTKSFINNIKSIDGSTKIEGNIFSLHVDRSGVVWVGTEGAGLYKFDPKAVKFNLISKSQNNSGLSDNIIRQIFEAQDGTFWIGTYGGINHYNPTTGEIICYSNDPNNPASLSSNFVFSVIEDSKGRIWAGTYGNGLNLFDATNKTWKRFLPGQVIFNITEIDADKFLIGTYGNGIVVFDLKLGYEEKKYSNILGDTTSISNNQIWTIFEDSKKNIWVGTVNGLNKFDKKTETFKHYLHTTNTNSLSHNEIMCIHEDKEGNLWLGTNGGGLNKFNPKLNEFSFWRTDDGLPSNVVYGILEDESGMLWMSTNFGLSKFNPHTQTFRNYDEYDGLQSNEFNGLSYCQSNDGKMFFGGIGGFNYFYPNDIKDNPYTAKTIITGFQIFTKPCTTLPLLQRTLFFDTEAESFFTEEQETSEKITTLIRDGNKNYTPYHINYTDEIELSYKDYVFSFDFASTHYTFPNKNKYRYILEPFEAEWNEVEADRRFVTYTNLEANTYYFKVLSSNSDGIWNKEPTVIKITITPPFWKTWWFRTLLIIAVITGTIGYVKYRERNLKTQKRILEEKVTERTIELKNKNIEVSKQKEEIEKQAEELELKNVELEKLSIVASETDNAVLITDANGNFEWVNEGFTRMFGFNLEQLIKEVSSNIVGNRTDEATKHLILNAIANKTSINYESLIPTRDGHNKWIQTTLTPIIDEHNNLKKLVAIDSDISEIKQAQEEILMQKEEIESQRDEIEAQRNEIEIQRDVALRQRDEIEHAKKEITDSIHYAKRIQTAVLPRIGSINEYFSDFFIFFKPRDIVSGDFYWMYKKGDQIIFTAADCTGHGVPGAFMSMLGVSSLNEIVAELAEIKASEILDKLKIRVIKSLQQTGKSGEAQDGMDMALCVYNIRTRILQFAGANNPLYLVRNNEMQVIKGDKMPIGIFLKRNHPFTNHEIELIDGDIFYMFSDGYADQFGGEHGRKFLSKQFKDLLMKIHRDKMDNQRDILDKTITDWQGDFSQVDDMLVIGTKV